MKINYTFANGEVSEVEVNEEIGNVILDSRREENNLGRKERYHCYPMDVADYEGEEYADQEMPESALFSQLENKSIADAFDLKSRKTGKSLTLQAKKALSTIRLSVAILRA